MAKGKLERIAIPKFPSEAAEAEWWDAHRAEANVRILAKLTDLAERTAADINQRADGMTPEKRAQADSETKNLAIQVQRRDTR
jgi:hypothetical protein